MGAMGPGKGMVQLLVVFGTLLRVAQHVVGGIDFTHAGVGIGSLIHVRVVLAHQLAVGFFQVFFAGLAVHTENLIVGFFGHDSALGVV